MTRKTARLPLDDYRRMLVIRLFEEAVDGLFARSQLDGTCHLCIGQEACAVGAVGALGPADLIVSTHRGHGHALARGADPARLMAELMGKAAGYCRGRGGTQHVCVRELGFLGTNGVTGGGIPIATGAALALQRLKTGGVVMCFFGDGASNQGTFHESLNMAAIWKLPVVFVCENNLYAMSMPLARSMAIADVAARAAGYGMPGETVDGMDMLAVREAAERAVARAREGAGPTLLEAKTYRFLGHSKSDRRLYRTREEEAQWRARDPIPRWRAALAEQGCGEAELAQVDAESRAEVEAAVAFALAAEFAPAEEAAAGVYA